MPSNNHEHTSLRLLLLFLAFILMSWPTVMATSFTVTTITFTILSIWLVVIIALVILAR
ncbi:MULTISPECIES: hypothetical protein [Vibrio]|uniref:hypothetical protein n=1 Tax=Vibrio TaxID=662 RepID=UPI00142F071F|nr:MULTISPECIES: hypothetical protein [Vibrio]